MAWLIRPETTADLLAIARINRLAFGRDNEARLVDGALHGRTGIVRYHPAFNAV